MAIPTNIKTLLSGNVVEWARIEFKATWDPAASLKSVCAFANDLDNWGGGYIVIGVEEEKGRPVYPLKGVPAEKLDAYQKDIFAKCKLIRPAYMPIIVCLTMFLAKLIFCLIVITDFTVGSVSGIQFIIILWALIAEEIGWRGYLLSFLYEHMKMPCLVPAIVGVIWCLWHYHYFMLGEMDVPVVIFSLSCIVESYIYAYLLDLTDNNLISAMIYHFAWNLFIHVFAINPNDNKGNPLPYVILVVLEIVIGLLLSLAVKKKGMIKKKSSKVLDM